MNEQAQPAVEPAQPATEPAQPASGPAQPATEPARQPVPWRDRDWAYWVQLGGLIMLWLVTAGVTAWFVWRALQLRHYGDAWRATLVIGTPTAALLATFASLLTYLFLKMGHAASGLVVEETIDPIEEALTHGVLHKHSWTYRGVLFVLFCIVAWAMYCWWTQLRHGLGATGLGRPVFWGLYITNFVFFIGISYGGTLVSAILRIANSEWRRAITRAAEAIAVLVLAIGGWNIILDLGRPDRIYKMALWGRLESPLMWDVIAITMYLVTCVLYLYLPLIPDLALLRSRVKGWRRPIYHLFSFGWTGSKEQKKALERAIGIIAVLVIPIAVSVHSVVGWVFSMTVQPLWHSTIFGPYFVLGAMFSGTAGLILIMAVLRRSMQLERFIKPVHFNNLGIFLIVLAFLWLYFTIAENLTVFYGNEPTEMAVFVAKFGGTYAPLFWTMVASCFLIPVGILSFKRLRTVGGTTIAAFFVVVGMWIERYTIVIPSLSQPRLPFPTASYTPTWLELSMMAGGFALFGLLYMVFVRLFPVVSLWEMREGREEGAEDAAERIRAYFPGGEKP